MGSWTAKMLLGCGGVAAIRGLRFRRGTRTGAKNWCRRSVFCSWMTRPPSGPKILQWAGFYSSRWAGWITADDLPADLRNRRLKTESYVVVTVDEAGKAAGCRILKASSDPRLDRLACDLLGRRAAFEPTYETPTRTIPDTRVLGVRWEVIDSATLAERERERAESCAMRRRRRRPSTVIRTSAPGPASNGRTMSGSRLCRRFSPPIRPPPAGPPKGLSGST